MTAVRNTTKARLNDLTVRAAKPQAKKYKLYDGGGIFLLVAPTGAKSWCLKYRYLGADKEMHLGAYDAVGLAKARTRAKDARELLADGDDPGAAKQQEKRTRRADTLNTFEAVALKYHAHMSNTWTPTRAAEFLSRCKRDLFPTLGTRPMSAIKTAEVVTVLDAIAARAPHAAHRSLKDCKAIFEYAISRGLLERMPLLAKGAIKKPSEQKHQPTLPQDEVPAFLQKVSAIPNKRNRLALQLLLRTAVRTDELCGATWDEFDLTAKLWTIPGARMKMGRPHLVPLSAQALALLVELRTAGGEVFVFGSKPLPENAMLHTIADIGYKGRMSGHGARSLFSTRLNEEGYNKDWIERQLAHKQEGVRGDYNAAEYLPGRTVMMQWWSDWLDRQEHGAVANVIPFSATAKTV
jgi:integrase